MIEARRSKIATGNKLLELLERAALGLGQDQDHEDEADAIRMERRERELLARIGRVRP